MSFVRENTVTATRKEHRCDVCHQTIPVGSEVVRWAGKIDGDFNTATYHTDCREAEVAFNREHGLGGCDWASLAYDREMEDDEWLVGAFPAVANRLGIVRLP